MTKIALSEIIKGAFDFFFLVCIAPSHNKVFPFEVQCYIN